MEFIVIGVVALGGYFAGYVDGNQDGLDKKPAPKKPAARPARRNRIQAGPVVVELRTTRRPQAIDPQQQQWSLEAQFKAINK